MVLLSYTPIHTKIVICITGDRNYQDRENIRQTLTLLQHHRNPIYPWTSLITLNQVTFKIIEGACRGADTLARQEAQKLGWTVVKVKPDWQKYGLGAGPRHNRTMLDMQPNLVLAFHQNIGSSKGTKDMISQAIQVGGVSWRLPVILVWGQVTRGEYQKMSYF